MSEPMILRLKLRSATTFARGDGVAGLVDREVEHDEDGFPFLRGRTLKGLLREAAEEVVFALRHQSDGTDWQQVKKSLFGHEGSGLTGQGHLQVGDARLPAAIRRLFVDEMERQKNDRQLRQDKLSPHDVLESLTGVRRQTAMNPYGAPDHATLRSMRVILRETVFESELTFAPRPTGEGEEPSTEPTEDEQTLLAAAALALRAAGTGRNRGRGWVQATLIDDETTRRCWARLQPRR
jgi:CRISPR/Cas system CSM-associated protein Csm3 (group 7 of RAMP superfamily)